MQSHKTEKFQNENNHETMMNPITVIDLHISRVIKRQAWYLPNVTKLRHDTSAGFSNKKNR